MTRRSLSLTEQLQEYLLDVSLREPPILARLRVETAAMQRGYMQIAPEQGQFMALLVELIGARLCLEIGTFTGYSALWIAHALPPDGRIICCDIDATATAIAQRYWEKAGLADRFQLRLGPALLTLAELKREYDFGSFDFVFIDADKQPYDQYYEATLPLVRHGGLILLDNMLWRGRVVDPECHKSSAVALKHLNRKLCDDERVSLSLLPIGDGLTVARKR